MASYFPYTSSDHDGIQCDIGDRDGHGEVNRFPEAAEKHQAQKCEHRESNDEMKVTDIRM